MTRTVTVTLICPSDHLKKEEEKGREREKGVSVKCHFDESVSSRRRRRNLQPVVCYWRAEAHLIWANTMNREKEKKVKTVKTKASGGKWDLEKKNSSQRWGEEVMKANREYLHNIEEVSAAARALLYPNRRDRAKCPLQLAGLRYRKGEVYKGEETAATEAAKVSSSAAEVHSSKRSCFVGSNGARQIAASSSSSSFAQFFVFKHTPDSLLANLRQNTDPLISRQICGERGSVEMATGSTGLFCSVHYCYCSSSVSEAAHTAEGRRLCCSWQQICRATQHITRARKCLFKCLPKCSVKKKKRRKSIRCSKGKTSLRRAKDGKMSA